MQKRAPENEQKATLEHEKNAGTSRTKACLQNIPPPSLQLSVQAPLVTAHFYLFHCSLRSRNAFDEVKLRWTLNKRAKEVNSLSAMWLRFWELFGYDTQPSSCTAKLNAFVLSTFLPAIAINNGPPLFLPPSSTIEFRQFSLQRTPSKLERSLKVNSGCACWRF